MKKNRNIRRTGALERLNAQLTAGTKPEKVNGKTTKKLIPLTEGDKNRIGKEIEILVKKK